MAELTLESLAQRVEALERQLSEKSAPKKDWRKVVGILSGSESAKQMLAETIATREAEREQARAGAKE